MKIKKLRASSQQYLLVALMGAVGLLAGCQTSQTVTTVAPGSGLQPIASTKPKPLDERFNVRLQLAIAYYQGGAYDTALNETNEALKLMPRSEDALILKGMIYAHLNNNIAAQESFSRAIAINPNNGDAYNNLGTMLCSTGNYMDGLQNLEKAASLPNNSSRLSTWLALGDCYQATGNVNRAESAFNKVLEMEARNPSALYALAKLMYLRNDLNGVRRYLDQMGNPRNMDAPVLWLGVKAAREQGDVQLMGKYARYLREQYPNSSEALALSRGDYNW